MSNNGKLVVLGIFFVALGAAAFGMLFRYQATRRTLQFWGSENVAMVADAPVVEAVRFGPEGQEQAVAEQVDISGARGLVHLRQALLEDRSFDWDEPAARDEPVWSYGLRFRDGTSSVMLVFSSDFRRAQQAGSPASVSTAPIAAGLATVFAEYFAEHFAEDGSGGARAR